MITLRHRTTRKIVEEIEVAIETISDRIQEYMQKALFAERQHNRVIAMEHEVAFTIHLPFVPNLDLLDLPGLVASNIDSRISQDLVKSTRELAESIITSDRAFSIFLLVVDVRMPVNHSIASQLVINHNLESTTIGVFTKLDVKIRENEDEEDNGLEPLKNGSFLTTHGWMACSSRQPAKPVSAGTATAGTIERTPVGPSLLGIEQLDRLILMEQAESKLFTLPQFEDYVATGRIGMPKIRAIVQELFEDFLCHVWIPKIQDELKRILSGELTDQCKQGLPLLSSNMQYVETYDRLSGTDTNYSILKPESAKLIRDLTKVRLEDTVKNCVQLIKFDSAKGVWKALSDFTKLWNKKFKNNQFHLQ
jgi:hypothetical protein